MAEASGPGTGWAADKSKGPLPKDWTWRFEGEHPWGIRKAPRGDVESLMRWMHAMQEWGTQVATKCRDLEERVRYLESRMQETSTPTGGKGS